MSPLLQAFCLAISALVLWLCLRRYLYSGPLDNIRGPASSLLWKANSEGKHDHNGWAIYDEMTEEYGMVTRVNDGMLGAGRLYISDPKALNIVLIKEQTVFEESPNFVSFNLLAFGPGLGGTIGDRHRKQRKLLNPVFSLAHIRRTTPILYETVHRLCSALLQQVGDVSTNVDVHHWFGRTALEALGKGGLGYSFDPLTGPMRDEYGQALIAFVPLSAALHSWRSISQYLVYIGTPELRQRIADYILPKNALKKLREVIDIMKKKSTEIFLQKKVSLERGDDAGEGKDIMSILLKANMEAADQDKLPDDELIAQMSTIISAGTDTTSNALARIFHLLSEYPDIQEKLRKEVTMAARDTDGDIPYDHLMELPYLDAVCREALRLYPSVPFVERVARRDTMLSLFQPVVGVDGKLIHEVFIPRDTSIVVNIISCNRSKVIWGEDALEFKPERWLDGIPKSVANAHIPGVYSNLMTFLSGGRSCIGFKFAQLEIKIVLAVLLKNFKFSLSDKDIIWNLAFISYPTVGSATHPELPLILDRIIPCH